ncbi:pentapeptide repeat-containing protein [Zhihengliuella alba]|uniref:pentapeptide repeat-containing protein n=1 Tax=Zhihengliuella alba TaxID=547018 RepID=UPI0031E55823
MKLDGLDDGAPAALTPGATVEGLRFGQVSGPVLDLTGARLDGVAFESLTADRLELRGAVLNEAVVEHVDVPVVGAVASRWRDVTLSGRLGSVEAYEAELRSVHFVGCKLSFVNLRGADLLDVAFTDCVIEELDLSGSQLRRVQLSGTRVGRLEIDRARLEDVDLRRTDIETVSGLEHLRGATFGPHHLAQLAPLMARALGLRIED